MIIVIILAILILAMGCMCMRDTPIIYVRGSNDGQYIIYTSNENKIKEYERFGLNIKAEKGKDLPEVNGTPEEVIIYKALEMPDNGIAEDTSLDVEGLDVGVNVRFLMDSLLESDELENRPAVWRVLLGLHKGDNIYVYEGITMGKLTKKRGEGFGFDPIFLPDGTNETLAELGDCKDHFSARKKAILNLLEDKYILCKPIEDIKKWEGEYQH